MIRHRRYSITIYLKSVEMFNVAIIILWAVILKINKSNSIWQYYFLNLLGFVQHKEIMCQINSSHKTLWDLQIHEEWNVFHEFFNHSATYFGPRPMAPLPSVHNLDLCFPQSRLQLPWSSRKRKSGNSRSLVLKKLVEKFGSLQKLEASAKGPGANWQPRFLRLLLILACTS